MDSLTLTAIIIEDEMINTQVLSKMLSKFPNIDIIDTADTRKKATEILKNRTPDILFLDIVLPDGSGFDILSYVDDKTRIIFTTSHGSYAVQAFQVNAVDYLLKPFSQERLSIAIERISKKFNKTPKDKVTEQHCDKLIIKQDTEYHLVDHDTILSITSVGGNYTSVAYSDQKPAIIRKTLKDWQSVLPKNQFIRIHRSSIINKKKITKLNNDSGNYFVFIDGVDTSFQVSRNHIQNIKEAIHYSSQRI